MLNSITKLAQSFGMEITAEGVETVEQLMFCAIWTVMIFRDTIFRVHCR